VASVATWFEVDIDSCAFREPACFFECQYFGVPDLIVAVKALAHDDPVINNDATYKRVRLYLTFAFGRECQSQIQEAEIEIAARLGFRQRMWHGRPARVPAREVPGDETTGETPVPQIEELSQIEGRRIPESVFALQLQIHGVRQTIVTKLDETMTAVR